MQSNAVWTAVYFLTILLIVLPMAQKTFQQMSSLDRTYRTPGHNIIRFGRTTGHNIFRFGKRNEEYQVDKNLQSLYSYNLGRDASSNGDLASLLYRSAWRARPNYIKKVVSPDNVFMHFG